MKNKAGELIGFEIKVATKVADDMGVKPEFKVYIWDEIIPALQKGEIDVIADGMAILAIPAAYTEEAWHLSRDLELLNIVGIALVSILFIAMFVYFNFYKSYLEQFRIQYVTRVMSTYLIALFVVAVLLTLVDQCPWGVDNTLAIKRIIVVAFPASMSATVTDALK